MLWLIWWFDILFWIDYVCWLSLFVQATTDLWVRFRSQVFYLLKELLRTASTWFWSLPITWRLHCGVLLSETNSWLSVLMPSFFLLSCWFCVRNEVIGKIVFSLYIDCLPFHTKVVLIGNIITIEFLLLLRKLFSLRNVIPYSWCCCIQWSWRLRLSVASCWSYFCLSGWFHSLLSCLVAIERLWIWHRPVETIVWNEIWKFWIIILTLFYLLKAISLFL